MGEINNIMPGNFLGKYFLKNVEKKFEFSDETDLCKNIFLQYTELMTKSNVGKKFFFRKFCCVTQQTFTCSKATTETLKKEM